MLDINRVQENYYMHIRHSETGGWYRYWKSWAVPFVDRRVDHHETRVASSGDNTFGFTKGSALYLVASAGLRSGRTSGTTLFEGMGYRAGLTSTMRFVFLHQVCTCDTTHVEYRYCCRQEDRNSTTGEVLYRTVQPTHPS